MFSAVASATDIAQQGQHVRSVPIGDSQLRLYSVLLEVINGTINSNPVMFRLLKN
jgi:hypothetical protein